MKKVRDDMSKRNDQAIEALSSCLKYKNWKDPAACKDALQKCFLTLEDTGAANIVDTNKVTEGDVELTNQSVIDVVDNTTTDTSCNDHGENKSVERELTTTPDSIPNQKEDKVND